jgi:hypothetical protein
MGNLGDIFEKKLKQIGIKRQVDAAMICGAFDDAILEVFGEIGTKNVNAISYRNNTLKVGVTSSSWASEISLRQLELKNQEKMNIIYKLGEKEL